MRGIFPLLAPSSTAFTLVYVDDVARAVAMVADDQRSVGEAMFIGHPSPQTAYAILRQLAQTVDRPFKPRRIPTVLLRPLAVSDFEAWREVRIRARDWLVKWEPRPLPGQPDATAGRARKTSPATPPWR